MEISWIQVAGLVAGSSVIAALINHGITILREHLTRGRDAKLSALYLALALEAYATACSTIISDNENFERPDRNAGVRHGNLEPLAAYPMEVDWKALGIETTSAAMTLRAKVDVARATISDIQGYGDEKQVARGVCQQAARIGLDALAAAALIRRHHGLPPMETGEDRIIHGYFCSIQKYLEAQDNVYGQARRRRAEMHTKAENNRA